MAVRRNGTPLDLVWVHFSLAHPRANDFLALAETKIGAIIPGAVMSVNRNLANTEALVKITASETFIGTVPGVIRNAIIRVYTEADHDEVSALVASVIWSGLHEI